MKPYLSFVFLSCISALIACTAPKYVFSPSTANLLQLDKQGEIKVAANYAEASPLLFSDLNHSSEGLDIQSAYAITKRAGLKADVYSKWESNESIAELNGMPRDNIKYKKRGIEISGGYYNFSKKQASSKFQLFAGVGAGKFSFEQTYNSGTLKMNYHSMNYFKYFLQPSLIAIKKKNYSLDFAARMSLLHFNNIKTDYADLTTEPLGYIDSKPSIFADFIIRHEFGFTKLHGVRFQVQNGLTNLLSDFSSNEPDGFKNIQYDYNDRWMAVGIILDMKKLFRVTEKE